MDNRNEYIDSSLSLGSINDSNSLRNEDHKNKIIKKNLITAAKAKNEQYDINNQEILKFIILLKIYKILKMIYLLLKNIY
jgi:hypothetical protein